jgi:hypothetical protein
MNREHKVNLRQQVYHKENVWTHYDGYTKQKLATTTTVKTIPMPCQ